MTSEREELLAEAKASLRRHYEVGEEFGWLLLRLIAALDVTELREADRLPAGKPASDDDEDGAAFDQMFFDLPLSAVLLQAREARRLQARVEQLEEALESIIGEGSRSAWNIARAALDAAKEKA